MSDSIKVPSILLVVSSYLPNLGGLQRVTSSLAGELLQRGYRVSVLTQRYPRTQPAREEIAGVPVERLHFFVPRRLNLQHRRLDLFIAGLFYFPATLLRLIWRIAREKPDVVNLHFLGGPALFLLLARVLLRFRLVVSLHGDDVEGLSRGTWFDRWVFRATLHCADAVTACSRYLLYQAQKLEPGITRKAHVIYNGVDITASTEVPAISSAASCNTVLAVGRMVPKKGFDVLLRAVAACRDSGDDIHLRLVGDGPELDALKELACALRLEGRVTFLGAMDKPAVLGAMACSRMVVVPSRQEPFGIVALEAMACGKPVVATCAGGLPEVLEGADAILVEPSDSAALSDAILNTLDIIERSPKFGRRNRYLAARFSTATMVDKYVELYHVSE